MTLQIKTLLCGRDKLCLSLLQVHYLSRVPLSPKTFSSSGLVPSSISLIRCRAASSKINTSAKSRNFKRAIQAWTSATKIRTSLQMSLLTVSRRLFNISRVPEPLSWTLSWASQTKATLLICSRNLTSPLTILKLASHPLRRSSKLQALEFLPPIKIVNSTNKINLLLSDCPLVVEIQGTKTKATKSHTKRAGTVALLEADKVPRA